MSFPETPALTDIDKVNQRLDAIEAAQGQQTQAINSLGANIQWLIDQAQGIFKVFSSPQFMNQILSGGIPNVAGPQPEPAGTTEGAAESGPAEGSGA